MLVRVEYYPDDLDGEFQMLVTEPDEDQGAHTPIFMDAICHSLMQGLYEGLQKVRSGEMQYSEDILSKLITCEDHGVSYRAEAAEGCVLCEMQEVRAEKEDEGEEFAKEAEDAAIAGAVKLISTDVRLIEIVEDDKEKRKAHLEEMIERRVRRCIAELKELSDG